MGVYELKREVGGRHRDADGSLFGEVEGEGWMPSTKSVQSSARAMVLLRRVGLSREVQPIRPVCYASGLAAGVWRSTWGAGYVSKRVERRSKAARSATMRC